jgi:uncharacterized protein (TIGR00369 family)
MNQTVNNPFDPEKNPCFGCGPQNPVGLKLRFEETENEVLTKWDPIGYFQGYHNVVHGGIVATLLDEVAAWFVQVKLGTAGVTSELHVKYLLPVHLSKGIITVVATLMDREDRRAKLKCQLRDGESRLCAEAEVIFFVYPEEVAKRKLMYPGKEAFQNKSQAGT